MKVKFISVVPHLTHFMPRDSQTIGFLAVHPGAAPRVLSEGWVRNESVVGPDELEDHCVLRGARDAPVHANVRGRKAVDFQGARLGDAKLLGVLQAMPILLPLDQRFLEASYWAFDEHRCVEQQVGSTADGQVDPLLLPRLNIDSPDTENLGTLLSMS